MKNSKSFFKSLTSYTKKNSLKYKTKNEKTLKNRNKKSNKKKNINIKISKSKKIVKKHKNDDKYKIVSTTLITFIKKDKKDITQLYVYDIDYDKYEFKDYDFIFNDDGYKYYTKKVLELTKNKLLKIFIPESLVLEQNETKIYKSEKQIKKQNKKQNTKLYPFYSRYFKKYMYYNNYNNNWIGNTILINTNETPTQLEYIAILGVPSAIIKFNLDKTERITEFYSLIGPSSSPYTIAYSNNYMYNFSENCKVKLTDKDKKLSKGSKINGWSDIYSYYNESKEGKKRISKFDTTVIYKTNY